METIILTKEFPKGSLTFLVPTTIEQVKIDLKSKSEIWSKSARESSMQCFLVQEATGIVQQSLITDQHSVGEILLGRTEQACSATIQPMMDLSGTWTLTCFADNIDDLEELQVEVKFIQETLILDHESTCNITNNPQSNPDKKGWVAGDFHTHTRISDGKMTRSQNIAQASLQQLDFFFATDHNVVTSLWPQQQPVLVFPGCEFTTFFGHCNFFGLQHPLFDQSDYETLTTAEGVVTMLQKQQGNGLLSINHPLLKPWEWQADLPLAAIQAIELINDPTYGDNDEANSNTFQLWSDLWNHGWKISGVGGSDSHLLPTETYPGAEAPSLIGDPTTFVHVPELTQSAVLDGVRTGKTMISRIGRIMLLSKADSEILPGKDLSVDVREFTIQLPVTTGIEYLIEWVFDGQVVHQEHGQQSSYTVTDSLVAFHWLRADVKDQKGNYVATFTPVYWHDTEPSATYWHEMAAAC